MPLPPRAAATRLHSGADRRLRAQGAAAATRANTTSGETLLALLPETREPPSSRCAALLAQVVGVLPETVGSSGSRVHCVTADASIRRFAILMLSDRLYAMFTDEARSTEEIRLSKDVSSEEMQKELIRHERAEIGCHCHVCKLQRRPLPAVRLATHHRYRRGALHRTGEEDDHRDCAADAQIMMQRRLQVRRMRCRINTIKR